MDEIYAPAARFDRIGEEVGGRIVDGPADPHLHLIECANDEGALLGLWRNLNARGLWTDQLTAAAAARKAQLLQGVAA